MPCQVWNFQFLLFEKKINDQISTYYFGIQGGCLSQTTLLHPGLTSLFESKHVLIILMVSDLNVLSFCCHGISCKYIINNYLKFIFKKGPAKYSNMRPSLECYKYVRHAVFLWSFACFCAFNFCVVLSTRSKKPIVCIFSSPQ